MNGFVIQKKLSIIMTEGVSKMFPFSLGDFVPYIIGVILFVLIIREIVTWYYKINLLSKQQNEQTQLLKEILDHMKNQNSK